jgi:hypothetical protein
VRAAKKLVGAAAGCLFALGAVGACSSSSSSSGPGATPDSGSSGNDSGSGLPDPSSSICGHPGDQGNSLGVGRFCQSSNDCANNTSATICAIVGDDHSFFCTFVCHQDGGADQCGENAECACQGGPCGCFPKACDDTSDGGSDAPEAG